MRCFLASGNAKRDSVSVLQSLLFDKCHVDEFHAHQTPRSNLQTIKPSVIELAKPTVERKQVFSAVTFERENDKNR